MKIHRSRNNTFKINELIKGHIDRKKIILEHPLININCLCCPEAVREAVPELGSTMA